MEKTALTADNMKKSSHGSLVMGRGRVIPAIACFLLPIALLTSTSSIAAVTVSAGFNPTPIFPKTNLKPKTPFSSTDPVLLNADEVNYDNENSIVTADGNVEIAQGETIILADHVLYDQAKNVVIARGNVSMADSTGSVYFADEMALEEGMKQGVVAHFKARLSDNSLFSANAAKKYDENVTELHKAIYSPCPVCAGDTDSNPLWQMRADHVVVDTEQQKVSYDDAFMEIYGVPVLYTPYFSHPTPNADNKSGLLTPTFKQSTNLGSVYKQPYYYTISPDKDITLTPILTTLEGPVLAGEYRQMFNNGKMAFDGSITQPQTRDAGGATDKGQNFRGHLNAIGDFNYDETTDWGFDLHRTSDDTYLRRYDFSQDSLLTSKIYANKYDFINDGGRSTASVQALKFDGLTADDNAKRAPIVLPLADFNWQSPLRNNGDRFSLSGNLMSLTRQQGAESRRLSATAGWNLPYISSDGQVIEFEAHLRNDIYSVTDQVLPNGTNYNGQTGRILPEASVTWRYPLISRSGNTSVTIEPIVMLSASPNGGNSSKIPNEDSQVPEFNTSNLFSPNRYSGYDQVETGSQLSYGLRGQAQIYNDKYIDWLLGQNYHTDTSSNFPFSNDPNSHLSDYVGKIGLNYDPFTLSYRTRLNKDTLAFNQNEVDASAYYYPFSISTSYLRLNNNITLGDKEELSGALNVNLTKNWQWGLATTRDLKISQPVSASTNLIYQNECIYILNTLAKTYTQDRDIKPAITYLFRVSFKNLD
jgi:LPS-assembly protein